MAHLMQVHKSITTLQGEDIVFLATDINLPGAVDWVMMQSCFGHHFMLVLEKQEKFDGHQQFFAIVQLIGTRKQAENFAYRLELNGHRRRLTWEATPRSIHEGVSSANINMQVPVLGRVDIFSTELGFSVGLKLDFHVVDCGGDDGFATKGTSCSFECGSPEITSVLTLNHQLSLFLATIMRHGVMDIHLE